MEKSSIGNHRFRKGDLLVCKYDDVPASLLGSISHCVQVEKVDSKRGNYSLRRNDLAGGGWSSWLESIEDVDRYYDKI